MVLFVRQVLFSGGEHEKKAHTYVHRFVVKPPLLVRGHGFYHSTAVEVILTSARGHVGIPACPAALKAPLPYSRTVCGDDFRPPVRRCFVGVQANMEEFVANSPTWSFRGQDSRCVGEGLVVGESLVVYSTVFSVNDSAR